MSDPSVDFLHPNNVCGRTLLTLTARGSAILAELLRLSEHIPSFFTSDSKYSVLLHDFRYLKSPELYDQKIDHDVELTELDEEFRENHYQLLERFYRLFESIYRYFADYLLYLEELHEGVFVQHTIENVLEDREGGQLLCEALYLYGVMLLLLDQRIEGSVREKLIIAHYRIEGCGHSQPLRGGGQAVPSDRLHTLQAAAQLPRGVLSRASATPSRSSSSSSPACAPTTCTTTRRPTPPPSTAPSPTPRSRRMLYILLYFTPELLVKKEAIMREIVDKHFPDNWVIPYYMGYTVDLSEAWAPYKAASTAPCATS